MIKNFLVLASVFVLASGMALPRAAFAQEQDLQLTIPAKKFYSRHALSVETLGKGGLYSLNYDYLASLKSAIGFGVSYQSIRAKPTVSDAQIELFTLPVYANFYFPFQAHRPFLSTAVTFFKAHATANIDLSTVFSGMRMTYSAEGVEDQEISIDKADMSMDNSVDLLLAVPSVGTGYEYRTADGAIFRVQGLVFVYDKIFPWAGLSFGVAL
ncbi:hypothetical protein [Bdellovibrio sp. HCB337]|uniref:hypothetical protein n=1 Tax=Bdellovibrio sp. HCB337 TaxID=3394358 RepID=UPI0039A6ACE8